MALATSPGGRWAPTKTISYGFAVHNFAPVLEGTKEGEEEGNPFQVPLEVGDEVYVFEQYRPSSGPSSPTDSGVWFRGYVVSTSPHPRLPPSSASDPYPFPSSSAPLSEEPQVSVGIFPASHVQIREQLEDAERRLSTYSLPDVPAIVVAGPREHKLGPLKEEDEAEDSTGTPLASPTNGSPSKVRNRTSVASLSSFANQRSRSSTYGAGEDHRRSGGEDDRPNPPLPSLKCGDETAGGAEEPLVDEIACALREWAALLYAHLYRRDYELFAKVKAHIEALHIGRRQLLAKTLSGDETEKLRREMVGRLVRGNVEQGLDVIVRHPAWGVLVDVEVEGEIERKGWVSAVRMYTMQVALAYSGTSSDGGLAPTSHGSPSHDLVASPSNPRLSVPNVLNLVASSTTPPPTSEPCPPTGAKFFHVFLDLRAFVANPCAPGETAELYFSLFNKTDARYVTEDYCVILNHNGAPARETEGRLLKMRTLFRDLSQHDVQDQIFLVCRIVKNGSIKLVGGSSLSASTSHGYLSAPSISRSETASFDSSTSQTGVDYGFGTSSGMLTTDRSGRQSYRRPFGCAVLEISQFNKLSADATTVSQEYQMPVFIPANEAAFSTLHEDIISSRIKEIEKSPRADHLAVNVRILYGETSVLVKDNPTLFSDVPLTSRLGFSDVVFPGDQRNEVYLKLWSGDFSNGGTSRTTRGLAQLAAGAGAKNLEVTAEVRTRDGVLVPGVISRGSGEPMVSQYMSMVFRSNNTPTWGELVKLEIPAELMEQCHVFYTFRSRGSKDRGTISGSGGDKPFAFAYSPLFLDNAAFIPDGSHTLVLYRYEKHCATAQFYFQAPPIHLPGQAPHLPPSILKTLIPLRDTMVVRSFLVSTKYTQNETLLKLLKWESTLLEDSEELKDALEKLRFCSEVEVCKFLRDIFDALFGILISKQNQAGEVDDLVFQALVTILGIVSDRRFTNFKPVLDVYIERHFTCSTASSHIIKSLHKLLLNPGSIEGATTLRSSIKVWHYLFKFIVRSREIQRAKDVGMGVTSDHLETTFKRELSALLSQVNSLMRALSPSSIIGTQTLAVQHFASILPDLAKCFNHQELADIAIAFGDSIVASKGKITVWKILLQNQLVNSVLFQSPTGRAALVPNIVRWLKPSLGKFDEHMMCTPKDTQATRDIARVSWVEGIRLAVGVVAAVLDGIHEALIDPVIRASRSLLGQEQDSIEYLLALLPRLLESYRELENVANLEAVERTRTQASVISAVPVVFPSSYPFSLLFIPPEYGRRRAKGKHRAEEKERPTLRSGVGEIACVFIVLLLLAPRKIFVNSLESTLEVEGKENFARQLTQIFRVSKSILENDAFPADWLNINILAHRVIVKLVDPIADILEREFIPPQQASFTFNTTLWKDFFKMLLKLLASPQLLIEEFSPQKRRAVWRLAGDIRGEGAKVLIRLWDAIGWPEERTGELQAGSTQRMGGYQIQFVPGLVEDVLSLCLSHHDELRSNAVHVLYSMIVSEYYLNDDFSVIEAEVIDRLDKLFMHQTKGDEISRAFFIGQLRGLFDEATIDDRLREQVDAFLVSINSFLDLLLAVRNLPEGEEYQEDRIISTLKLMSFIRGIGRSEIYVRYVNRLVTYHVALGSETEAGLTLKLHADLHVWNLTNFVDPIPDLDLPRQTEFARKETLYMRILGHLSKGKAWEVALTICKELQHEYETQSFSYHRLSELLILQSELYANIVKSDRHFGEYFRVAFYGNRFPQSICGKQFVYRGAEFEKLGTFVEKMLNKHPGAQLLKTSTIPGDEIQYADGQFLQITSVIPDLDQRSPIFTNPDVPQAVRSYYEHNDTNLFSFTRPVNKDSVGRTRFANDFTSVWTEKTVLICEDSFPTVLRRSEVVEIRITEISPIENALADVEGKKKELDGLERRYHALSQTQDRSSVNTNLLSMALNGTVDAPLNQGVPMYRNAFFTTEFMGLNPDKQPIVRKLETAINELVLTIARCMKLHAALSPPEMQPFHNTLEKFFGKNFAEELARLPQEPYEVPLSDTSLGATFPRATSNGIISISASPSVRHDVPERRNSLQSVRSSTSTITATPPSNRRDSTTPSFHIPPISPLNPSSSRTPSFYTSGGRSLDALAENGPVSPLRSGPNSMLNGRSSATSTTSTRSGTSDRRSVLGSLGWRRKESRHSTLAEE